MPTPAISSRTRSPAPKPATASATPTGAPNVARSWPNPGRARALLDAVRAQLPSGPRLVAFFAVLGNGAIPVPLPTAGEAPPVDVLITEDAPTPRNPLGAKGAGEGGAAAAGAAVANAVSDALGAEARRLPLSPERVLRLAAEGDRR